MTSTFKIPEKELQKLIWKKRRNWEELIDRPKLGKPNQFCSDLTDLTPERLAENLFLRLMKQIYRRVRQLELIGCEVPFPRAGDANIRADLLGVFPGTPGLAVLELKRDTQTERQAFTELLAYANHLAATFPGMCRDDVWHVLIAPMKTRIVRDSVLQTLLFDRKPIIALQPCLAEEGNAESIRLVPWVPSRKRLRVLLSAAFSPENLEVEKVVWEGDKGWDEVEMNRVAASVAAEMERAGLSGFVFASKSWPEQKLPLPNAVTLVAVNPYSVANRLAALRGGVPAKEIGTDSDFGLRLTYFIPGLKKNAEARRLHRKRNFFIELRSTWNSHLGVIGYEVVNRAIQRHDGSNMVIDRESYTWSQFKDDFIEDVGANNYALYPTGLMREIYWSVIDIDFAMAKSPDGHPLHGELPVHGAGLLNSQYFFRAFIQRMLRPSDPEGIMEID